MSFRMSIQLLANSSCGFRRSGFLDSDNFHQIHNPAKVVLLVLLARKTINLDRDGRVWFSLFADPIF